MIANTAAILAAGNRITELEADRESILKQMGGYIIEVTELRAKLEKAREAMSVAHKTLTTLAQESDCNIDPFTFGRWGGDLSISILYKALALLSADNVIASIKVEALREAAEVCEGSRPCRKEDFPDHWKIYEEVWGPWDSALVRTSTELRRMADELLQEKQNG